MIWQKHVAHKLTGKELISGITFIIPSIGRDTLSRTIDSLKNQTNPNWNAVIIFDGVNPSIIESDERIKILAITKTGRLNHAGEVRNYGMNYVITEWIGFVDDDDTLTHDYVECFYKERGNNDVVIFRMKHNNDIIPPLEHTDFSINQVGISFCLKSHLFKEGFQFEPSSTEDFYLLDKIRAAGKNISMSEHITYYVRPN